MKTAKTIVPKNGQFPVALLAGGPADLAREIGERLREKLGVVVAHHWEDDKPRQWQRSVPSDVDLTIFLKDFASHSQDSLIARQCSAQGVPLLRTQRKWATMYSALHAVYGMSITAAPKPEALPPAKVEAPPDAPAADWKEPDPVPEPTPTPRVTRRRAPPATRITPTPPTPRAPDSGSGGTPTAEAMVLIGQLMGLAARDRFSVMITPTEVTISGK